MCHLGGPYNGSLVSLCVRWLYVQVHSLDLLPIQPFMLSAKQGGTIWLGIKLTTSQSQGRHWSHNKYIKSPWACPPQSYDVFVIRSPLYEFSRWRNIGYIRGVGRNTFLERPRQKWGGPGGHYITKMVIKLTILHNFEQRYARFHQTTYLIGEASVKSGEAKAHPGIPIATPLGYMHGCNVISNSADMCRWYLYGCSLVRPITIFIWHIFVHHDGSSHLCLHVFIYCTRVTNTETLTTNVAQTRFDNSQKHTPCHTHLNHPLLSE